MARFDRLWRRQRGLLFGASLLAGAVLACNGILGLSDFDAVECTGGVCDGGAGFDGGDAGGDAGEGGALVDANGTAPVSWAHFKMPNYPQADGPDANIQTYAATTGGFVDSVSGLAWREPIPQGELGVHTYEEAKAICAAASSAALTWRLPSRIELVTLLDLTQSPAIDKKTFSTTEASAYWTSSEVRPFGDGGRLRWTVNFSNGFNSPAGLGQLDESGKAGVRCIRAQ